MPLLGQPRLRHNMASPYYLPTLTLACITHPEGINLLITKNSHALTGFQYLVEPGATAWRAVSIDLPRPCVLVHCAEKDGPAWLSQTVILWRSDDVLSFCRDVKADTSRKIWSVAMLCFENAPNEHELSLTPFREVWTSHVAHMEIAVPVYITATGEQIDERGSVCSSDVLEDAELVWHAPKS